MEDAGHASHSAAEALATQRQSSLTVRLTSLGVPWWRTLGFLSPPAQQRRAARYAAHDVPVPDISPLIAAHVLTDELCLAAFKLIRKPPTPEAFRRIETEVDDALTLFEDHGWLDDPAEYIGDPPPLLDPAPSRAVAFGLRVQRLSFDSLWEPRPDEPGRQRWLAYTANRRAHMHVIAHHDGPRPWLVYLHGTGQGRPELDTWVLRVKHLHEHLGLNIVLPVLPLHGSRRPPRGLDAQFPTIDVLDNVHGLAQGAWDVRRVLSWVRTQQPTAIGLTGLSLGGYLGALVAGLESPLDCVILGMPAVDFPRLLRRHTPREVRDLEDFRLLGDKSDRLHRAVSPLLTAPLTAQDRRYLYAGTADRLLDPVAQVAVLWTHWNRPSIKWVPAGHVGHLLFDTGIRMFVDDALRQHLPARDRTQLIPASENPSF